MSSLDFLVEECLLLFKGADPLASLGFLTISLASWRLSTSVTLDRRLRANPVYCCVGGGGERDFLGIVTFFGAVVRIRKIFYPGTGSISG